MPEKCPIDTGPNLYSLYISKALQVHRLKDPSMTLFPSLPRIWRSLNVSLFDFTTTRVKISLKLYSHLLSASQSRIYTNTLYMFPLWIVYKYIWKEAQNVSFNLKLLICKYIKQESQKPEICELKEVFLQVNSSYPLFLMMKRVRSKESKWFKVTAN